MKNFILLAFFAFMLLPIQAAPDNKTSPLNIAGNGRTSYVIVTANDATVAEKNAANQLQKYLQQITGASFEIKAEDAGGTDQPQILVGAGRRVKALLPEQNWDELGQDGIVIKSVGSHLILVGGRPRGTLYAVFQFLEDSLDCRWWTPAYKSIPQRPTVILPPQNTAYVPVFRYREHYTASIRSSAEFATIMRQNGHGTPQGEEWGGHYTLLGGTHTFSKLLPLKDYFKEHPEWYSDPNNGFLPCTADSPMPSPHQTDPCLSSPQVLAEITKNALAWIKANPKAGYISISQNDNSNSYCRDPKCMELIKREGSPSAPLIQFVNAVAAEVHKQYPDFIVETLAYHYSEDPPKTIRPASNVLVRMAPIVANYGRPMDSEWNKAVRNRIKRWEQTSSQLFMWGYVTNFCGFMLPHPNWDGLAKDLRFYAANKVTGIFEEGNVYTNEVGDFAPMRTWVIGKLMWNPMLDQDRLIDEFLHSYYGVAAPYLRRYIDLYQQSYLAQDQMLSTFNTNLSFITLDVANESVRLFEQAENAVKGDKILLERVRQERLSLDIALLLRYNALKRIAAREKREFLAPQNPQQALVDFEKRCKALGVKNWRLGSNLNDDMRTIREALALIGHFSDD